MADQYDAALDNRTISHLLDKSNAFGVQLQQARKALDDLISKLELISSDGQFNSVFVTASIHGHNYSGPNWEKELEQAKAVLATIGKATDG